MQSSLTGNRVFALPIKREKMVKSVANEPTIQSHLENNVDDSTFFLTAYVRSQRLNSNNEPAATKQIMGR